MPNYTFERQARTPYSEVHTIRQDDEKIGQVDLHFGSSVVYATLVMPERLTEDEIMDLIDLIDEDLVTTADMPRDDFVVTVYQGREIGVFSDEVFGEEEEEIEGEEE